MKVKYCKWCDNQFETEVSYQIYCSSGCRESATREKIADRYLSRKRKQWSKKDRICKSCGTRLSIYNDTNLCESCLVNPVDLKDALRDIRRMSKEDG
jgi:hypothetical protein